MNPILVKIFATALALSQVTTRPDAVKTAFDPVAGHGRGGADPARRLRAHAQGLRHRGHQPRRPDRHRDGRSAGAHRRDQGVAGIELRDLHTAYGSSARTRRSTASPVDLGEVIDFYNKAVADLPDHTQAQGPQAARRQRRARRQGERFAEVFEPDHRRLWVPLADIPRACAEGVHRGRGQALLPAQGHRRARRDPRLHRQPRQARPAAGRLDHHPAGGEEPAGRRRRDLRAQDPRDDRGVAARADADQGRDPRALSQLDLSRPRRLGHRDGGAQLFRQAGEGARRSRRARCSPAWPRGRTTTAPTAIPSARASASPTCWAACKEDGAIGAGELKQALARAAARSSPTSGRAATPASISSTS